MIFKISLLPVSLMFWRSASDWMESTRSTLSRGIAFRSAYWRTGVYKVPYNLKFFPTAHFFSSSLSSPKFRSPSLLDILPSSQDEITFPFPFSMLYSSTQPWYWIFPYSLYNWILFRNSLNKFPPHRTLYTPAEEG